MSSSINLASQNDASYVKQQKNALKYTRVVAVLSLLGVAAIAISFFLITVLLPLEAVKKDQQSALSGIANLHRRLVTYALIKDRLDSVKNIMISRKSYPATISMILNIVPSDLSVDSLSVDASSFKVSITGESLLSVNDFINNILDFSEKNKSLKNLEIVGLSVSPDTNKCNLSLQADIL